MPKVYNSSVIDAPPAKVWELVGNFNGLPSWHSMIRDSKIENVDVAPNNQVGCNREIHLQNGDRILEKLLARSDDDMFYTYSVLESPMPMTGYVSTIRLTPITDGDRTFIQWSSEFECAQADADGLVKGIGIGLYQPGFDSLKKKVLG